MEKYLSNTILHKHAYSVRKSSCYYNNNNCSLDKWSNGHGGNKYTISVIFVINIYFPQQTNGTLYYELWFRANAARSAEGCNAKKAENDSKQAYFK